MNEVHVWQLQSLWPSSHHKVKLTPQEGVLKWRFIYFQNCWQTSAKTVYKVSSMLVVYVKLVLRCLDPSAGLWPIRQLQSKDPTHSNLERILFSQCQVKERERKRKNQCLLFLSAVMRLEPTVMTVSLNTHTLTHGEAGIFMLPGIWSMASLSPAVCKTINDFYIRASG